MKRFNGHKMSHGPMVHKPRVHCPICNNTMVLQRGVLRCTEIKRTKKQKSKGDNATSSDRRIVKHGSITTITKRMRQQLARQQFALPSTVAPTL